MKANPFITRVSRNGPNSAFELAAQRRREAEEKQRAAHQAALHVIDVMDAIRGPIPATGPRTATPPAAVVVERSRNMDQVVEEIRLKPAPVLHQVAQNAQTYLTAMVVACAFLAGIALGKAL
jgi:hypothetical protein